MEIDKSRPQRDLRSWLARVEYPDAIYHVSIAATAVSQFFKMTPTDGLFWRPSGWSGAELEQRRKVDGEKIKIARRLRAQTTMTWGWRAERLVIGTPDHTADCLHKT